LTTSAGTGSARPACVRQSSAYLEDHSESARDGAVLRVVVLLFLLQVLVGGGLAHYRWNPEPSMGSISQPSCVQLLRTYHCSWLSFGSRPPGLRRSFHGAAGRWRRAQGQRVVPLVVGCADRCGAGSMGASFLASITSWAISGSGWGTRLGIPGPGRFWQFLLAAGWWAGWC